MLKQMHQPKIMFQDASTRQAAKEAYVDLYVATPPCQPWSCCGKRKGLNNPRGKLLKTPVTFIKRQRPRVALIENVRGLASKPHRPVLFGIKKALVTLGYKVRVGILTKFHRFANV